MKNGKKTKKISNPSTHSTTPSAALSPSLSFSAEATKEPASVSAEATTDKSEGRQGFG